MGKFSGMSKPEFLVPVMNFYMEIHTTGDGKTFEFGSDNLLLPSLRHIQRLFTAIPPTHFVNLDYDSIVLHGF